MLRKTHRSHFLLIASALLVLLSGCNVPTVPPAPVAAPTNSAAAVIQPTAVLLSTATAAAQPADPASIDTPTASAVPALASSALDINGVAQSVTSEAVATVPFSADDNGWSAMPEYNRLTLEGYLVTNRRKEPQIFVFPVKGLEVNQSAARQAKDLQTLLQTQQPGTQIPYLPLEFSAMQAMRSQFKYLDFKNGKGVRFLTQWGNGMSPINNNLLLYTYQGLTNDGQFYVSAIMPINLPGLASDSMDLSAMPTDIPQDYRGYLANTVSMLDQQPASAFIPDLGKLDAMVQSMEIK